MSVWPRQHYAICCCQPWKYAFANPGSRVITANPTPCGWEGGPSRLSLYGARFWIDQ